MIWNFELCISGPAIPAIRPCQGSRSLSLALFGRRHPVEMKLLGMAISGSWHVLREWSVFADRPVLRVRSNACLLLMLTAYAYDMSHVIYSLPTP